MLSGFGSGGFDDGGRSQGGGRAPDRSFGGDRDRGRPFPPNRSGEGYDQRQSAPFRSDGVERELPRYQRTNFPERNNDQQSFGSSGQRQFRQEDRSQHQDRSFPPGSQNERPKQFHDGRENYPRADFTRHPNERSYGRQDDLNRDSRQQNYRDDRAGRDDRDFGSNRPAPSLFRQNDGQRGFEDNRRDRGGFQNDRFENDGRGGGRGNYNDGRNRFGGSDSSKFTDGRRPPFRGNGESHNERGYDDRNNGRGFSDGNQSRPNYDRNDGRDGRDNMRQQSSRGQPGFDQNGQDRPFANSQGSGFGGRNDSSDNRKQYSFGRGEGFGGRNDNYENKKMPGFGRDEDSKGFGDSGFGTSQGNRNRSFAGHTASGESGFSGSFGQHKSSFADNNFEGESAFGKGRVGGGGFGNKESSGGFGNKGSFSRFGQQSTNDDDNAHFGSTIVQGGHGFGTNVERAPRDYMPAEVPIDKLYLADQDKNNEFTEDDHENISVYGGPDNRITNWQNSGLEDALIDILLNKCKFSKPRPIQAASIPHILAGKDIVSKAETGSGKTLAFVLPIVDRILKMSSQEREPKKAAPLAIVVEPVRELAKQVYDEFQKMTLGTKINVVLNYGQTDKYAVIKQLDRVDIYIGTPGRLMDFLEKGNVSLARLKFFVVDEADEMLKQQDMAHLGEVINSQEFQQTANQRQTMLFSATMNDGAMEVAKQIMRNDKVVNIQTNGSRVNKHVKQVYMQTNGRLEKTNALDSIFEKDKSENKVVKTLIFVETKRQSDVLAMELGNDFGARSINGDRPQNVRDEIMADFKSGKINLLVGTDVCARGLDINLLDRVIIYDTPKRSVDLEKNLDEFAHRMGRTGRARQGTAIIFCDNVDKELARGLVTMASEVGQEAPQFLRDIASGKAGGSAFGNTASFGGGFGNSSSKSFGGFGGEGFGKPSNESFGGGGGGGFGSNGFEKNNDSEESKNFDAVPQSSFGGFGSSNSGSGGRFGTSGFGNSVTKNTSKDPVSTEDYEAKTLGCEAFEKRSEPTEEANVLDEPEKHGFRTGFHTEDQSTCDY